MKKNKTFAFFPDFFTLAFCFCLIFPDFAQAKDEKAEYSLYEKNYRELEMETLARKKIKMEGLGSKIVILNFWASWCIPCLEEIPSMIKLAQKYKPQELMFVMVNTDEENQLKNIAKTQRKFQFSESFIFVPDNKFKIADKFKFSAIPVTVIYKEGKVIYFSNGPVDFLKVPADL